MTTLDDLPLLDEAIERLAEGAASAPADALSAKPFRRRSVLKALHEVLGLTPLGWRQDDVAPLPASVAGRGRGRATQALSFDPFSRYCSDCHDGPGQFPPGFLNGDSEQVATKLSRCGQKILHRLSLWSLDPADRPVSPMPPAHWIAGAGFTETEWLQSDALRRLQSAARKLVDSAKSERWDVMPPACP